MSAGHVIAETEAMRVLDTRALPWEPHPYQRCARVKPLIRAKHQPAVHLLWVQPGAPLDPFERHRHARVRELIYVLSGEIEYTWFEDAEDAIGTTVLLREGFWIDQRPGAFHRAGTAPETGEGCKLLIVRAVDGHWVDHEAAVSGSVGVPFPEGTEYLERVIPRAELQPLRGNSEGGVIVDGDQIRILDTRAMPWTPYGLLESSPWDAPLEGHFFKPLSLADSGQPFCRLGFFPPGILPHSRLPARWAEDYRIGTFVLHGGLRHPDYATADSGAGEGIPTYYRPGLFLERGPGSIHGLEAEAHSEDGAALLSWCARDTITYVGPSDLARDTEIDPARPSRFAAVSHVAGSARRGFVSVGTREVHYRHTGSGRPLAIFYRETGVIEDLVEELGRRGVHAIAFDIAGCGLTDPLDAAHPPAADYAADIVEAMRSLGYDRFSVCGVKTGGPIAFELGVRYPEHVISVLIDSPVVFTDEEIAREMGAQPGPIEPELDGSHLLRHWAMRRNQNIFSPPNARTTAERLAFDVDLSDPWVVDNWVHDYFIERVRRDHGLPHDMVVGYDPVPALRSIQVPTALFTVQSQFAEHLDRIERLDLSPAVRIHRFPVGLGDDREWLTSLDDMLGEEPVVRREVAPRTPGSGSSIREFVDTPFGRILVRRHGAADRDPLLLIPPLPFSSKSVDALARKVAESRPTIAIDLLGSGESDRPDLTKHARFAAPVVDDYAEVISSVADLLGLSSFDVYGRHAGATLALVVGTLDDRVERIVLDAPLLLDDDARLDFLARGLPDLTPVSSGAHLVFGWNVVHDSDLWYPWYARDSAHSLGVEPSRVEELDANAVDVLKAASDWDVSLRAVLGHPLLETLAVISKPTLVYAEPGDTRGAAALAAAAGLGNVRTSTDASSLIEFLTLEG